MGSRYLILDLVAGERDARRPTETDLLEDARSEALRRAKALRPAWLKERPVWCDGSAWHQHPDAGDATPVGGYDVGDTGSAVVIFDQEDV